MYGEGDRDFEDFVAFAKCLSLVFVVLFFLGELLFFLLVDNDASLRQCTLRSSSLSTSGSLESISGLSTQSPCLTRDSRWWLRMFGSHTLLRAHGDGDRDLEDSAAFSKCLSLVLVAQLLSSEEFLFPTDVDLMGSSLFSPRLASISDFTTLDS